MHFATPNAFRQDGSPSEVIAGTRGYPLDSLSRMRYIRNIMQEVALHIPEDLRSFIDRSVKSGLFSDPADFVLNLLYTVKAESEVELSVEQKARLTALRDEIVVGLGQAERGEFAEFTAEEIIAQGEVRAAAR